MTNKRTIEQGWCKCHSYHFYKESTEHNGWVPNHKSRYWVIRYFGNCIELDIPFIQCSYFSIYYVKQIILQSEPMYSLPQVSLVFIEINKYKSLDQNITIKENFQKIQYFMVATLWSSSIIQKPIINLMSESWFASDWSQGYSLFLQELVTKICSTKPKISWSWT